jgi:hypothetical protein
MPSVKFSDVAISAILRRCKDATLTDSATARRIPLLVWPSCAYFVDNAGRRSEVTPQFYFGWTNAVEIQENGYFTVNIAPGALALAPGMIFQKGSHLIEQKDDRLTLVSHE